MKIQTLILLMCFFCLTTAEAQTIDLFAAGHQARQWGDYPKAFESFKQAQTAAEKANNQAAVARALTAQGSLYFLQSKPTQAVKSYRQALEIARRIKDKTEEARAFAHLGQVYGRLYKYEDSIVYCQKAERLAAAIGNKEIEAAALRFLGRTYGGVYHNGYYEKAFTPLEQSRRLAVEAGDEEGELAAVKEIGVNYQASRTRGECEKALDIYLKIIPRLENSPYRRLLAVTRHNTANCLFYRANAQYQDSKNQAEKLKKYGTAFDLANQAIAVFEEIGDAEELNEIYNELSRAYANLENYEKALEFNSKSIAAAEEMRRTGTRYAPDEALYFEGLVAAFSQREQILTSKRRIGEAFLANDAYRARTLLETWQRRRVNLPSALLPEEIERRKNLDGELTRRNRELFAARYAAKLDKTKIAELKTAVAEARLTLEDFENEIVAAHPELVAVLVPPAPITLSEAVDLLPDDETAIIEFSGFGGGSISFYVLTRGETNAPDFDTPVKRISTEQITSANGQRATLRYFSFVCDNQNSFCGANYLASDFARQIATRNLDYKTNAQKLYELLIKPVSAQLAGKNRLIIVPDAGSWQIPFAALLNENGRFLIEDFAISYAPSLAALREMRRLNDERRGANYAGDLLALGNPTLDAKLISSVRGEYRDNPLQPLPDAEREVKNLGKIYGNRAKILIGSAADETALKREAGNYRFVHLATHSISNREKPMYSHVLLAKSADEDGLVEAWEIARIDLNAEMVVLSACETAGGRIAVGDGAIGLSWAFFVAGTPTTVASQWRVESAETAKLMTNFHRQLQTAPNKSEALRRAALEIRQNGAAHPFYWASFILLGDERQTQ